MQRGWLHGVSQRHTEHCCSQSLQHAASERTHASKQKHERIGVSLRASNQPLHFRPRFELRPPVPQASIGDSRALPALDRVIRAPVNDVVENILNRMLVHVLAGKANGSRRVVDLVPARFVVAKYRQTDRTPASRPISKSSSRGACHRNTQPISTTGAKESLHPSFLRAPSIDQDRLGTDIRKVKKKKLSKKPQ